MNRKGKIGIAIFITLFAGIVVAIALLQGSASNVATTTTQQEAVNRSFTAAAVNVSRDLVGQELLSTPLVINNSNVVIASGNYTIAEGLSTVDGLKRIRITFNDQGSSFASKVINVTYSYGAEGYIDNSGGRSIASTILIFAALAIAVFVIAKVYEDGVDIFG